MILLETLILAAFQARGRKKAPSEMLREGRHTREGEGVRNLGPDTVTGRNQPLFELSPGGFPKDSLDHSSRGA